MVFLIYVIGLLDQIMMGLISVQMSLTSLQDGKKVC